MAVLDATMTVSSTFVLDDGTTLTPGTYRGFGVTGRADTNAPGGASTAWFLDIPENGRHEVTLWVRDGDVVVEPDLD